MRESANQAIPLQSETTALHERAQDNLRYIRDSMESASSFTAVSGKGFIIAGLSALLAAWIAWLQSSQEAWLGVWMVDMLFAGGVTMSLTAHKARLQGDSLWSTNGRKLLNALLPTMTVGAIITLASILQGNIAWLPGIWLAVYGAAVITAGAYSISIIPVIGTLFLMLGALVLLTPVPPDLMLGVGFGGLHIVFGYLVWRDHGG